MKLVCRQVLIPQIITDNDPLQSNSIDTDTNTNIIMILWGYLIMFLVVMVSNDGLSYNVTWKFRVP